MRKFDIYYGPGRRRTRRFVLTWVGTFAFLLMVMYWINSRERGMEASRADFREALGKDPGVAIGEEEDDDDE